MIRRELNKRLEALEARMREPGEERNLSPEVLRHLSDEDLDALEEVIEDALERGMQSATFEELYAVATEKSRWSLEVYFSFVDAWREGREMPAELSRDPPDKEPKNGYRIWKYRKQ